MYDNYLIEKADEIRRLISKLSWVKEYQVFLQAIKEISSSWYEDTLEHTQDTVKMGFALQMLSNTNQFEEHRGSMSNIDSIIDIEKPRSNMLRQGFFSTLRQPNSSSITGDYSKSIDMDQDPTQIILEGSRELVDEYQIPFTHDISVSLENRVIFNESDELLLENSLRTNYQLSSHFAIKNQEYNLSRIKSSRSLDLEFGNEVNDLVKACIIRFKSTTVKEIKDPVLILHPNVVGSLLANYFYNINLESMEGKMLFNENIQIYDDPLRRNGYYSHLFDDQGTLCKSLQLVENGMFTSRLTLLSENEEEGGNGYRVDAFQPRKRSYEFPIRESHSNLVVSGGAGRGEYFHERPGQVLVIKKAFTSPGVSSKEGPFILYVTEAEIYENGDIIGPVSNLSIRGKLSDILALAHFSADSSSYLDPSFPILVNTGWISVPHSLVSIQ